MAHGKDGFYAAEGTVPCRFSWNEFHIAGSVRGEYGFAETLFASSGNVLFANPKAARVLAARLNERLPDAQKVSAGSLNAMGLIDEILHYCCGLFRERENPLAFDGLYDALCARLGAENVSRLLLDFTREFPPRAVYTKAQTVEEYFEQSAFDPASKRERSNKVQALEELILLRLANENPAFKPFFFLFNDEALAHNKDYDAAWALIKSEFKKQPLFGPYKNDLITMLKEPVMFSPNSLQDQLEYIRKYWGDLLGVWLKRLLAALDIISEEQKPAWFPQDFGPPDMKPYVYNSAEYERFSEDREWMPKVVLLAKMALVWLNQLSRKYGREICRLDQIPDEELDVIAARGFTGLWLIGIWERSHASKRIKHLCGNPDAAASAYSLLDYEISGGLGGWGALDNLRARLWKRGVRLAADMVPNHTGIDSHWVSEKPDLFMSAGDNPYPQYSFSGENLSHDARVSIYLEDHYYSKTDCAVVFKRVDNATGHTRYMYHGNDGTGLPWNDTAQIDFLNPAAREEVMQKILHVAHNFPIIRFDAAMVLAKKHIRRLWYPEPGHGGDIASRAEFAVSEAEFERRIPEEFWREVVDRVAREVPDTLLLAEAFWMLEGFFVRTLGMHRVYNSAFMNMLKKEDNQKYRETIKNTLEFDPQVLKRFVNFMNNPDEETAEAQFGKGDKYFGICTMMVTMPGLPMFGHGQIEGFTEKYGMEYTRDYKNEAPDDWLVSRHEREIFPLMKKRYVFAEIQNFLLFDVRHNEGVNENVFAYANRCGEERAVVFYNNVYQTGAGWIKESFANAVHGAGGVSHETRSIAYAMGLSTNEQEYCVFREFRSNLWFIRKSSDIQRDGLFIQLSGFEAQIFMDISCVYDDETRKYAVLCGTLAGRGVRDIDEALEEIFLKDLFAAFDAVASKEFLAGLKNLTLKKSQRDAAYKNVTKAEIFDALQKPALEFFAQIEKFLTGNYGARAVFDSAFNLNKRGTIPSQEILFKRLTARLSKFLKLWDSLDVDFAGELAAAARALDEAVPLFEMLALWCVLYSLKEAAGARCSYKHARSLIALWALDKRLARAAHKQADDAASEDTLRFYAKLSLAALPLCAAARRAGGAPQQTAVPAPEKKPTAKSAKAKTRAAPPKSAALPPEHAPYIPAARAIAGHFLQTKDALLCGVNRYNDVLWYNKNNYESAALLTLLLRALFASNTTPHEARAVFSTLIQAETLSEYQVEKLLELLKV